MSTTVREEYEVGDLDPAGVLEARRRQPNRAERRAAFRKLQLAAHWADLHPATSDTGVETFGGAALLADESLGGDGTPAGGGVHPRTVRVGVGHVPVGRGTADRRRPRPAPPPPDAVETSVPVGGAGLAGPPGRPPDPPAVQGRRDLGRRTARRPRLLRPRRRRPAGRPSDRGLRPRGHTRTAKTEATGRLGRHPHPPRGHRLPRHLPPRSHRRHPGPQDVLRPGLRASPTSCSSTATPDPLGVRKIKAIGILTGQPAAPASRQVKVYARVEARDLEPDALAVGEIEKLGAATLTKIRDLGRPPPGRHPTRAQHGPPRRRRLPRPTRLDARPRPPPRRPLHLPEMPGRRQVLRPRPHHPLRRERTTRPNQAREPRLPVPATPPRQDHRSLAVPPHARRRLPPGTARTAPRTSCRRVARSPSTAPPRAGQRHRAVDRAARSRWRARGPRGPRGRSARVGASRSPRSTALRPRVS